MGWMGERWSELIWHTSRRRKQMEGKGQVTCLIGALPGPTEFFFSQAGRYIPPRASAIISSFVRNHLRRLNMEEETLSSQAVMHPSELTIIVAATNRSMGIGLRGTLPWALKKDMAYFARVTKRTPQPPLSAVDQNSVIMGRKTWESIPEKFRPLKDRFNIVVSRTMAETGDGREFSITSSLQSASEQASAGTAFIIGGAEIYRQALELPNCNRILLTRILSDFETDVSFPVVLNPNVTGSWKMSSKEELDKFVGEQTPDGVQVENGTRYLFEMWERAPSQDA